MSLETDSYALPEGVWHKTLSKESLLELWDRVKGFDRLFSDSTRGDPTSFWKNLLSDCIVLETEGGILTLRNIQEHLSGEAHLIFWDCKLSPKTELVRECLVWAFTTFDLQRIGTSIPVYAKALRRFLTDRLGFQIEGRLRNNAFFDGVLIDTLILSILREEILKWGKHGKDQHRNWVPQAM